MPGPADITYGVLSQSHGEYNAELWWKLQLLYRGGFEFLEHADQFLHRAPNEPEERYRHRIQEASYICYFGQIVDYLAGALFHEKLQVLPSSGKGGADEIGALPDETFYREFAKDADRCGMPFSGLMGSRRQ